MTKYYEENYISATGNYDIYVLFLEKSFQLINNNGISSYIMPHKFLITDFGIGIRKFLKKNTAVDEIVHFGSEIVFQDASTYTCIINTSKSKKEELYFKKVKPSQIFDNIDFERMNYGHLSENNWDLQSESIFKLIEKLKQQPYTVSDVFDKIFQGIATSLDAVYVFKGQDKGDFIEGYNEKYAYHFEIEKELVKPFIKGNQLSRYSKPRIKYFVLFPYQLSEKDATSFTEKYIKDNYPKAYSYLKHFEKEIRGRERGRMDIEEGWFLYIYPKNLSKFHYPKIMTQEISKGCNMTFDEKGIYYHPTTIYSFVKKPEFQIEDKYYLGILNSNLMWFFLKNTGTELRGGFFRFKTNYLKPFPLPKISINANVIITKVNKQLSDNQQLQTKTNKFLHRTKDNLFSRGLNPLKDVKMSKKLTSFYDYDFKSFVSELKKKKIILSLTQQDEWEEYFNRYKSEINQIQVEIDKTDNEINQMVYELYGLTDEEIRIVEEASI